MKYRAAAALSVLVTASAHAQALPGVVMHAGRHDVAIVRHGNDEHVVTIDGRTAIDDRTDQYVLLVGPYSGKGATYVLVAKSPGGNACPVHFQALAVSAPKVVISPAFGNCNDQPAVTVNNGVLDVVTPAFGKVAANHVLFDAARGLRPASPLGRSVASAQ